jgi:hypothetical protein
MSQAPIMELAIRIMSVRQLPPGSVKGPLRVQATIGSERKETGNSVWGKGFKSQVRVVCDAARRQNLLPRPERALGAQEAVWLKGPGSALTWSIEEAEFQRLKAYSPKTKVYVHTGEEVLAWCMLDLRDLALGGSEARWVKLQGTGAGGELRLASHLRCVAPKSLALVAGVGGRGQQAAGEEPDAFPIGSGGEVFVLTFALRAVGGDGRGLLLPGPGAGGMWLSYYLFDVVAQTDKFESLEPTSGFRPISDMFRLRSSGDGAELTEWFQREEQRHLDLYLCTENRIIAVAKLDLSRLVVGGRGAGALEEDFFPHEDGGRMELSAWDTGAEGGAWVEVYVKLERDGWEDEPQREEALLAIEADEEEARRQPQLLQAPPPDDERGEEGGGVAVGAGAEREARGGDAEDDDDDYSDDFGSTEGGGRQSLPGAVGSSLYDRSPGGFEGEEANLKLPAPEPSTHADAAEGGAPPSRLGQGPPGGKAPETPKKRPTPAGKRRFRLSLDLRSVRDLRHAQHVFLYYHYPFLPGAEGGATSLDNPVLSQPVWAPANIETPMANSCCLFHFTSTYTDLMDVATRHPFIISVRAKEGGGGEIGKVGVLVGSQDVRTSVAI